MVRSITPSVELGKILADQVQRQSRPLDALAERADVPKSRLLSIMKGEEVRSPWQFYERIFDVFGTGPEIRRRARRMWELWRDAEAQVSAKSLAERDRVHRLRADLPGYNLQPDPLHASTKEEFLAVMREFHVWAGEPSYREIAIRARKTVGASTLCEALDVNKPPRLPTLKVVMAFIYGCGGNEDDLTMWTTAWRQVRIAKTATGNVTSLRPAHQRNFG